MAHDRSKCLYCNGTLTLHERLYGACSECIKARAKAKHWRPHGKYDGVWIYVDNAPRWKEYGDFHDMDDDGVIRIVRALAREGAWFGQEIDGRNPFKVHEGKGRPRKQLPPGVKHCQTCGKLIPESGLSRCPACRQKLAELTAAKTAKRKEASL